ncbi:MAG: T9SS type A sorting domain-containing protein [Bacteroidia bacterium]|nr:T9SS type A sorting domain-containing protein [Bacteroidia bacterium]MBP7259785.1 T9SS type A sorting domain-containing protein [Bacteroidia bacterium]MBP9178881.1 T9SS type A sorting domain-containing protein [Bacteroidia bacterium]MBP9723182.1 T9SS type A sorting domain-containing protein [Bacteroidia bacterium]
MRFGLISLLFIGIQFTAWSQTSVYFSTLNPKVCTTTDTVDISWFCGATPNSKGYGQNGFYGGWWSTTVASKKHCFIQDTTANSSFGYVVPSCLGVNGQNGNPASWKITYHYRTVNGDTLRDSVNLTVAALPQVLIGSDTFVCNNADSIQFQPYPNFANANLNWVSPPSPLVNHTNSPLLYNSVTRKHTFYPKRATQDSTYMLVYKATDNMGCENTDTAYYHIKPLPVVNAGVLGAVCNDEQPFSLSDKSGASPTGGSWMSEPFISSVSQFGILSPKDINKDTVILFHYTYTNLWGCSATDTVLLKVSKVPLVTLTVSKTQVCESDSIIFLYGQPHSSGGLYYLNSTGLGVHYTYNYFIPNKKISPAVVIGVNKALYVYKNPATGCRGMDSASIIIDGKPDVEIIASERYEGGLPFLLKATKKYTTALYWSRWGDGQFSFGSPTQVDSVATSDSALYVAGNDDVNNRTFTVLLRSANNGLCPADADTLVVGVWPTGVKNLLQSGLRIYPIPAYKWLYIEHNGQKYQYTIHNQLGQVCLKGEQEEKIDIGALKRGVYFLTIQTQDGNFGQRILVQ